MTTLRRVFAVIREAWLTTWAQKVSSGITILMIAGMCATVFLTTGRTVGAEQSVLGTIDSSGTTLIIVRAQPDAGLDTSVLGRISAIDGIRWSAAFGASQDATNVRIPGSTTVSVRDVYGENLTDLGIPRHLAVASSAWASSSALAQLGMPDAAGGIVTSEGKDIPIAGKLRDPGYLGLLEPAVFVLRNVEPTESVAILLVIAKSPALVAPVTNAVRSLLAVTDPTKVKISTSANLAKLRAAVQGQLGSFGRNLVFVVFGITGLLVASILYGLVMLRRKDFGRRRALGATRGLIVALLLIQMAILAVIGCSVGTGIGVLVLAATGDPYPGTMFILGVDTLAVAVGLAAALFPAVSASRRDPLKELRVP